MSGATYAGIVLFVVAMMLLLVGSGLTAYWCCNTTDGKLKDDTEKFIPSNVR